jgi:hypothetical protein
MGFVGFEDLGKVVRGYSNPLWQASQVLLLVGFLKRSG